MRDTINIPAFGGINKLHTRDPGQSSKGQNFWTRGGSLVSRGGSELIGGTTPFMSAIRSIHTGVRVGVPARLLVEEGRMLWVRPQEGAAWTNLRFDLDTTGTPLNSAIWKGFLLLFSGTRMLAYDIQNNTIADITNSGGNPVPVMQHVAVDKDIIFGWSPDYPDGHLVRFNGYTKDAQGFILGRSQNEWPPDFALNVSGSSGTPVLDVIPFRGYRFCLTQTSSHLIYGDNEDDFRVLPGDNIGAFRAGCSALAGNIILWLNFDIKGMPKVYAFTGTQSVVVSQPIEELLMEEDFSGVFAKALTNQFWLIFPGTTSTKCYIYDTDEQQWYIYTYPAVIRATTLIPEQMREQTIHFGLQSGGVLKLNESNNDFGNPIVTEMLLGPFSAGAMRFRLKRIWLEVEPRNNFSIQVYATGDQWQEKGAFSISAKAGNPTSVGTRIHGVRGRSIFLRLVSTSRINELQQATLVVGRGGD